MPAQPLASNDPLTTVIDTLNYVKRSDIKLPLIDYKLNLIVGEIERANNDYVRELEEIDNYYVELEKNNSEKIKELDITKKDKNE